VPCAGADRATIAQIDHADYAHGLTVLDVLCSLTAHIRR
jgi:hypothetical protein